MTPTQATLEAIRDRLIECRLTTLEQTIMHDCLLCIETGNADWPCLSIVLSAENYVEFYFSDDICRSNKLFKSKASNLQKIASFVSGVLAFSRA